MELTPHDVYLQSTDLQRILIIGSGRTTLAKFVKAILDDNLKKYIHFVGARLETKANAAIALIEAPATNECIDFKHHVLLICSSEEASEAVEKLILATPKSGIVIYPENSSNLKSVIGKLGSDVQTIPYKTIPHDAKDRKTFLISSTNEKFPTEVTGSENLLLLAAAKEIVRKIGISSGQFYRSTIHLR